MGSSNLDWWSIARNNEVNAYAVAGPSLNMQQHLRVERIGPPLWPFGCLHFCAPPNSTVSTLTNAIDEEEWWIDEI